MTFADEDTLLVPSCNPYAVKLPKGELDKMTDKKKAFTIKTAGWKTFKRIGDAQSQTKTTLQAPTGGNMARV